MAIAERTVDKYISPAFPDTKPLTRENNTCLILLERYRSHLDLTPGQQTKILHLLTNEEQALLKPEITLKQEGFWQAWYQFRCQHFAGEGEPNFDDVMRFLPNTKPFAQRFINPEAGAGMVDLFSGPATLATYLTPRQTRGLQFYIAVDKNPELEAKSRAVFTSVGVKNGSLLVHDLLTGIPDSLKETVASLRPRKIHFVSNFGITYLPADEIATLARQIGSIEKDLGIPAVLELNMLKDGSFNPELCRRKFIKEVVPRNLHRFPALKRAIGALKQMTDFGNDVKQAMPIWYPEEIAAIIATAKFNLQDQDPSLNWGQSIAMRFASSSS